MLNFSTQNSVTKKGIENKADTVVGDDNSWSLSPSADYKFSQKFRGGLSMDFKNSKDITNKIRKIREVSIWGEMTF